MRFQGLAVVLAKQKWPEFIACERKKDLGLDAYARSSLADDGKGLVCSITATFSKLAEDAARAREHFNDVTILILRDAMQSVERDQTQMGGEAPREIRVRVRGHLSGGHYLLADDA